MNKAFQSIVFFLLFFTSANLTLYARKDQPPLVEAEADMYYEMQEFDKASEKYLALLANRDFDILTNDRINIKYAINLYRIRRYEEAEKRFGAVIVRNIAAYTPEYACAYVATLIRNNKFKQAADLAKRFNNESAIYRNHQPLQNYIDGIEHQFCINDMEMAHVDKALFNQPGSNSASVRYKDGVIFVNNESDDKSMIKKARFFYDDGSECKQYTKVPYTMQAGPSCFSRDGKTIYYTDNRYRDGQMIPQRDEVVTNLLRIVELNYNDKTERWEKPKDVFSDKSMFSLCHPALSEDGQRLYFSANFEGEKEGMNIYMSRKTKKGWGRPISLGPLVNTKGKELFPNIYGNVLSFSSDGHKGLGGMDVYTVQLDDDGLPVAGTLKHMPYPINTIYNDYALMYDNSGRGFFTSDRPDKEMLDVIYSWNNEVNIVPKNPLLEKNIIVAKSQAFSQPKPYQLLAAESMAIQLIDGSENPDATAFFEYNSDKLSRAAKRELDQFVNEQRGVHPTVVVLGYADIIGTEERNIELSTQRAEAVKQYMVSRGFPELQIETVGKGKLMLTRNEQIKSPDIKERLAPARKAEIKILNNDVIDYYYSHKM